MTVLRTAYVNVLPKTDGFDSELKKRIRRIDARQAAEAAGSQAGESFGSKMAARITAVVGAAGIGSVLSGAITQGLDVGAANDKLRAQLNLTKEESGRLGKAAGQLYASNYGESMGEVNDAIAGLVRSVPALRNASVPVLKEISSGALDIVRVFDQDMAGVTSAVSSMLRSGLAPNAQFALDLITKGLQSGADKGQDFLDTLTEYSVQFVKVGLDGPAALGVINQLLAGGARNSDLAADAIKEFSIRAIDGSALTADSLKALGLNAEEMSKRIAQGGPTARAAFGEVVARLNAMEDPVKRNIAGVGLFGTQFEDLGGAFRSLDVSAVTDGLGQVAGATKGIADQSALGRIESFKRALQTGFVDILGNQVLPRVIDFGKYMRDHKPLLIGVAAAVGAIALSMTAYYTAVGIAKVATVTWTVVTKVAAAAQWALNVALSANPIGLVVLALGALVAGVIVAYKNSETFRNIVQGAWRGIQVAVSFAWNNVIKPAVEALVWYFRNIVAPYVMFLWNNVFKPAWTGISYAVKVAWGLIQIALAAFRLYLTNVLIPIIRFLWANVVKPVFSFIAGHISMVWNKLVKPVFEALGGFIRDKVAPAFSKGVDAIKAAWDRVKAVAAAPVRFVIETVINKGVIGGINWVADKVGAKGIPPVPMPPGLGDGHGIKGISAPKLPKGAGDGGGFLDSLVGLFRGPTRWVSDRLSGPIGQIKSKFGNNPFTRVLTGAGGKLKGFLLDKVKSLLSLFDGAGGKASGGLQAGISGVLATMRSVFGSVPVISGVRPGARTLSGAVSYHASGRAIDIAPVYAWARFLNAAYGGRLRELITPWNDLNILNGRPHRYTGAVWNQHNFAGGNAHIHAAMDDGGMRMLRPGWNLIPNGTGRREPIYGPAQLADVVDRLDRLREEVVAAVGGVAPGVGREINGTGRGLVQMSRAR